MSYESLLSAGRIAAAIIRTAGILLATFFAGNAEAGGQVVPAVWLGGMVVVLASSSLSFRLAHRWSRANPTAAYRAPVLFFSAPIGLLVVAGIIAVIPNARPYGPGIALITAFCGVAALMPYRNRHGKLSGPALLLALSLSNRRKRELSQLTSRPGWPERTDVTRWMLSSPDTVGHCQLLVEQLRGEGQTEELTEWHARLWKQAEPLLPGMGSRKRLRLAHLLHGVTYHLLLIQDLAPKTQKIAERGEKYIDWAYQYCPEEHQPAMAHSMALAYLRQGRYSEVEPLCTRVLRGNGDLKPQDRATVLATVVLARVPLGQEPREWLDEAVSLAPDADLVQEAVASVTGSDDGKTVA